MKLNIGRHGISPISWPADLENSWRKLGEMGKRGNWDLVKLPQCIQLQHSLLAFRASVFSFRLSAKGKATGRK